MLAGLNPGLAGTVSDRGFLPERLLEWLEALEQLAPNTPVAEVFDALSGEFPEEAIEFERDARLDAGGLRGLSQAEAYATVVGPHGIGNASKGIGGRSGAWSRPASAVTRNATPIID
ncbi:MAG: hypothetical protein R3E48_17545 [Burkholderiaceae bacterium]